MQNNSITSQTDIANVTVVTDERQIIVPQAIINVVEVNTPGPRGPQGPAGSSITGGATNYIPVWSSTSSLTTSSIYVSSSTVIITGSLSVSGSITSSLFGTASWAINALTASYALNGGGGTTFPYSGSAIITGSLVVLGPTAVQENLADNALYGGQVIQASIHVSVLNYNLVYLETDGIWYPSKNDNVNRASKMQGICVDTTSGYVLLEGDIGVSDDNSQGAYVINADHGLPVYIDASTGWMTTSVPLSGIVRILGHIYYQSTTDTNLWTMKFRPSNDWYEQ